MDQQQAAYLKFQAAQGALNTVRLSMRDVLAQIASQTTGLAGAMASDYAKALASNISASRDSDLKAINDQVAKAAQKATVTAYLASRKNSAKSYRYQDTEGLKRFSNKQMLRALQNQSFYSATARGISFGNTVLLDAQAAQWARLNFGALPASQPGFTATPLTMFGESIPGFNLNGYQPSEPFRIPYGAFGTNSLASSVGGVIQTRAPAAGAPFYVYAKDFNFKPKFANNFSKAVSRGIRGARFLDKGVDVINQQLPPKMERIMLEWVQEAFSGTKGGKPSVSPFNKLGYSKGSAVLESYADAILTQIKTAKATAK